MIIQCGQIGFASKLHTHVRYKSEYETPIDKTIQNAFIAHIIEEGDLLLKKMCKCMPWNKCMTKKSVKLSQ